MRRRDFLGAIAAYNAFLLDARPREHPVRPS